MHRGLVKVNGWLGRLCAVWMPVLGSDKTSLCFPSVRPLAFSTHGSVLILHWLPRYFFTLQKKGNLPYMGIKMLTMKPNCYSSWRSCSMYFNIFTHFITWPPLYTLFVVTVLSGYGKYKSKTGLSGKFSTLDLNKCSLRWLKEEMHMFWVTEEICFALTMYSGPDD